MFGWLHRIAKALQKRIRASEIGIDRWVQRFEAQRTELENAISSYAAADTRGAEMAAAVWRL